MPKRHRSERLLQGDGSPTGGEGNGADNEAVGGRFDELVGINAQEPKLVILHENPSAHGKRADHGTVEALWRSAVGGRFAASAEQAGQQRQRDY